jgi:hypothetical protein
MKHDRGTKSLFLLRPRCIRAERPWNPYVNQSTAPICIHDMHRDNLICTYHYGELRVAIHNYRDIINGCDCSTSWMYNSNLLSGCFHVLSSNHKHLFLSTTTGPDNKHSLRNKCVQKISYLPARHLCCWLERRDQIPGHLPEPLKIARWPDGSNSRDRNSSARRFPRWS